MSKGLSQLIVIVLVLLIAISLTTVLYVWASQTAFEIYPEETQEQQYYRQRACLGIEQIRPDSIVINNCGAVPLEDFIVYIEGDKKVEVDYTLNPGYTKEIDIAVSDGEDVYVTSNYAQSPVVTYNAIPVCGNNIMEGDEVCDGEDLDGKNCTDFGYSSPGNLACKINCQEFIMSGCPYTCGDGNVEPGEECDDFGTGDGDGCSSSCEIELGWECSGEPSSCYEICGDTMIVGSEVCDGANTGEATCASVMGPGYTGTLGCLADCTGYDTSACFPPGSWSSLLVSFGPGDKVLQVNPGWEVIWENNTILDYPVDAKRLDNGNTLIAELSGDRVIEVDPSGTVVWEKTFNMPCDADRLDNGNTLITGSASSGGTFEVDPSGDIVWSKTDLYYPHDAERLDNGNTLITVGGAGGGQVIEVDPSGTVVWEKTGLSYPWDADRLDNGNTLIACGTGNRVIEVDPSGTVVWEKTGLSYTKDAKRLDNGNTLIAYTGRIIEVDPSGDIVWSKTGLNDPFSIQIFLS